MNNPQEFDIRLEKPFFEKHSAPPEDPLGELSHFEMGLRRFCFECNHQVSIKIGNERILVFLDPDICMILDTIPEQISKLARNNKTQLIFAETCCVTIQLLPLNNKIICILKKFGYSAKSKQFELDKTQVLGVLRRFIDEVIQLAVDRGYIKPQEKDEFLIPAFSTDASVVFPA